LPFKGRAREWFAMTPDEARRLLRLRAILGEPFNPAHFRELLWAEFRIFLAKRDEESWRELITPHPLSESISATESDTDAGLNRKATQKGG
jgi:hypothetical protein